VTNVIAMFLLVPASMALMALVAVVGIVLYALGRLLRDVARHVVAREVSLPTLTWSSVYSHLSVPSGGRVSHRLGILHRHRTT
jgi:hypothetical protein